MEIKQMPIDEKYDNLLDFFALYYATSYVFNKEHGIENKWPDYLAKVMGDTMPNFMGSIAKMMKTVAPSKTFKKAVNQMMYMLQMDQPLSNLELSWVSDREATIEMKDCEFLKRMKKVVKKADFNIDPREVCKSEIAMHMSPNHPSKNFGIEVNGDLKENGCKWTFKLK